MEQPYDGTAMRKATKNHLINFPSRIIMAKKTIQTALSPRQAFNGQRVLRISGLVMKVATWNVRSVCYEEKLEDVVREMERLKINILGISDVQRHGSGKHTTKNGTMYFSCKNNSTHRYGVAIIVDKTVDQAVIGVKRLSDRVMILKLQSTPTPINVIQVYAPIAKASEDDIKKFYEELTKALKTTKNHEVTFVLGDFNAIVGQGEVEMCVGRFGLGKRNERGDRLVESVRMRN